MKIIKQTAIELVLQESFDSSMLLLFWVFGFVLVPLFIGYVTLADAGVTTLICERLEPTQVSCEYQQSQFFGLVNKKPIQLQQVMDVRLDEETRRDDEGSYQVYRVRLITRRGELPFTDFSPDYTQNADLEFRLRDFLGSKEPYLQETYDARWLFWQTLLPLAAIISILGVGIVVAYGMLRTRTLILDRRTNRAVYHTWTLLGNRYQYISFRQIRDIDVREEVENGETHYEPVFLPMSLNKFPMFRSASLAEARQMAERVRAFLQLPTQV